MECVFCKIVNKELPAFTVYEDENFMAFLDIRPMNPGHTLIIPKKHYEWTWEVENFGDYFEVAKKVALAAMKALDSRMVNFLTAGLGVPHAHIHVVPRFENDGHGELPSFSNVKQISEVEMREIAEKIKSFLTTLTKQEKKTEVKQEVIEEKPEKTEKELTDEEAEYIRREIERV
jgi:histidine triad (HIT) family protein